VQHGCPFKIPRYLWPSRYNLFGPITFRVRTLDKDEPGHGVDGFGIELAQNSARASVVDWHYRAEPCDVGN